MERLGTLGHLLGKYVKGQSFHGEQIRIVEEPRYLIEPLIKIPSGTLLVQQHALDNQSKLTELIALKKQSGSSPLAEDLVRWIAFWESTSALVALAKRELRYISKTKWDPVTVARTLIVIEAQRDLGLAVSSLGRDLRIPSLVEELGQLLNEQAFVPQVQIAGQHFQQGIALCKSAPPFEELFPGIVQELKQAEGAFYMSLRQILAIVGRAIQP